MNTKVGMKLYLLCVLMFLSSLANAYDTLKANAFIGQVISDETSQFSEIEPIYILSETDMYLKKQDLTISLTFKKYLSLLYIDSIVATVNSVSEWYKLKEQNWSNYNWTNVEFVDLHYFNDALSKVSNMTSLSFSPPVFINYSGREFVIIGYEKTFRSDYVTRGNFMGCIYEFDTKLNKWILLDKLFVYMIN